MNDSTTENNANDRTKVLVTFSDHVEVGVQTEGRSPDYIKLMAWRGIAKAAGDKNIGIAADVGGGRGDWANQLKERTSHVFLLDYAPPSADALPEFVTGIQANLNERWPLADASVDFLFSLEVVEHLENPRHFFREIARATKPGGFAFVSTPNNHSLTSKITFFLRGQHRLFQEFSYPAHITPLLICDFERIADEVGLSVVDVFFTNHDVIPKLHWRIPFFKGRWFSDSIGVLFRRK